MAALVYRDTHSGAALVYRDTQYSTGSGSGTPFPQLNLFTIMRVPQVNMTANLGAPVNITGNLL